MSPMIDIDAIASFDDVLRELKTLDRQLPLVGLDNLATFNMAYAIITQGIKDSARRSYFNKPDFIEKFTVCFASFYFRAINDILSRSPNLPTAWAKLRDVRSSVPIFITLLMGANAHINHDLPLAMADFLKANNDYSLRDARRVDRILVRSGKLIIPAFREPTERLNTLKRQLRFFYFGPTMLMVLYWRIIAWRNFRALSRGNDARSSHEKRSFRIANRLLRLGRFIQTPR